MLLDRCLDFTRPLPNDGPMNIESLLPSAWMTWVIIALVAGILEVAVPMFTFSFVSIAAGITALTSTRYGLFIQFAVFIGVTLLSILVLRPRVLNRWQRQHNMPSRSQALINSQGVVTEAIDSVRGTGRVMVEGQDWAAKSHSAIAVGKSIKVENHDGIVLIVREI